jgi:hypothetical protein
MFAKFAAFVRNFFRSAKADPVSTGKGIVQVAAGTAISVAVAKGQLPANELTTGSATALITSGLHAIGTDAAAITGPIVQAQAVAEHYKEIKRQQGEAAAVLNAVAEGAALIAPPTRSEGIRG